MKPEETTSADYDQPVAYDANGNPLYKHPVQQMSRPEAMVASQAVHLARPAEPAKPFVSDATKVKHDRSHQLYPTLNLSEAEYIIAVVRRHPIGLFIPFALAFVFITIGLVTIFNYDIVVQTLRLKGVAADGPSMILPLLMAILLICLLTYVAYYIYTNNKFFLTNESIIEQIQTGLFSHAEKSIDLASIEDVSYTQKNILQVLVGYGSIRLSTIGDETSYRYDYVSNPKAQVDVLKNAVESFKNGRAIG
jgi:hypothetical protein